MKEESPQMKKCPFCGGVPCLNYPGRDSGSKYTITCLDCNLMVVGVDWDTELSAVLAWNGRVID